MDVFQSLAGAVTLEVTSAEPMALINALQKAGIQVMELDKRTQLQYRFQVARKQAGNVRRITEKRGDSLKLCGRSGIFWTLWELRKRPVLVLGLLAIFAFSLWVPSRIFFVRVEGNTDVPTRQIIDQAQLAGITFGASRREVRSEKMKNNLLNIMPQLQWAGVNTYGCLAVITVRERNDLPQQEQTAVVSSIVANYDGIIRQMTVTKGNALCRPGEAVKAGQVLVSGYTDCGIYIQATQAEAEIYAQTQRNLTVLHPTKYLVRNTIIQTQKKYSFIIGKKRINLTKDSGILDTGCAKIETECYMTLPGGFQLPVGIVIEQYVFYETQAGATDTAESFLQAYAKKHLQQQMTAGRIEHAGEVFTQMEDVCRLDGVYGCYESLGITRMEENLNHYAKDN